MTSTATGTPERVLPLPGAFNLRDLGGYPTIDGRVTRWRRVLRADGLHRCDLGQAPIRFHTLIDLRTASEREATGSVAADAVTGEILHLPVLAELWEGRGLAVDGPADEFLAARYREMLDSGAGAIVRVFEVLSDPHRYPVVFHCTAGKDRTGVTAALLLSALGVDDHTIAEDYGHSRAAVARFKGWLVERHPEAADEWDRLPTVFLDAPPAAMARFLRDVRTEFGSPRAYLQRIGVDDHTVANIRAQLLARPAQATASASRSDAMRPAS